jgi:hypothetical protein
MGQQTQQASRTAHSGQMTAVMRSASTAGRRVLRLGLVRNGRVVEERVIKRREPVTVGASEKNQFVVAASELPSRFRLFDVQDDRYVLQFTDSMQGKIALPTGLTELADLRSKADRVEGIYRFDLSEDVRGKVTIGDSSFLFQFVAPPPVQPKPQLPVSVTRGAVGIDWVTTMIAAFSFLAHFMGIGAVYSDWLDPVVDYDANVASLVESVRSLPPPPEVEQKNVEEEKTDEAKVPDKKDDKTKVAKQPMDRPTQRMSRVEAAALARELDSFDMGILGANIGNTATSDVLSASDSIATSVMDQAAASGAGVSSGGPGGLNIGAAGGAIRPGAGGNSLASIGSSEKSAEQGSGKVVAVKGPTGNASVGGASVAAGGQVSNASRVVARMRAQFRSCYTRGLSSNPDIAGRISLRLSIGAGGEVTSVTASSSGNLPSSVVECVKGRARAGRFAPPEGGMSVIAVPVTFVKQ